jgi:hypothetical protein
MGAWGAKRMSDELKKQLTTYADAITAFAVIQAISLIYAVAQGEGIAKNAFKDTGPFWCTLGLVGSTCIYCFLIYSCEPPSWSSCDAATWIPVVRLIAVILSNGVATAAFWALKLHPLPLSHADAFNVITTITHSPPLTIQGKGWMDIAALVIGILTFGALAVYTWLTHCLRVETHKLLRQAELQNEIAIQPVLAVRIEDDSNPSAGHLVMENVGLGPAFNISIENVNYRDQTLRFFIREAMLKPNSPQTVYPTFNDSDGLLFAERFRKKIHSEKVPQPIPINVRCVSLGKTAYSYLFHCESSEKELVITFHGMTRSGESV